MPRERERERGGPRERKRVVGEDTEKKEKECGLYWV